MKNLEYFKFNARDWLTGNITGLPLEARGLFIHLCAELWDREGRLQNNPKILAGKFHIAEKDFNMLMELFQHPQVDILKIDAEGFIRVKFIDKQIREFERLSESNRRNVMKRWHPRQGGK